MYDRYLLEDLKGFKQGSDNIYELQYRYETIYKIIRNRTLEKVNILKYLLSNNFIDRELYNELLNRAKSDYKKSHLYLIGLITLE